ncbi:hypothetical protein C8Q80DRAFT_1151274 [Daedaleopsis nitida]|nr:hypothetical protein C8Q80DRAFT_1151274 [Daedaleopsis nitida]
MFLLICSILSIVLMARGSDDGGEVGVIRAARITVSLSEPTSTEHLTHQRTGPGASGLTFNRSSFKPSGLSSADVVSADVHL